MYFLVNFKVPWPENRSPCIFRSAAHSRAAAMSSSGLMRASRTSGLAEALNFLDARVGYGGISARAGRAPSPATRTIFTVLKAGETVVQAGELPKTL